MAIRDSENVSSITDNGTGNYSATLTTALANTNGCSLATAHGGITNGFNYGAMSYIESTTAIRIMTVAMSSASATDQVIVQVAILGGQA